MKRFRAYRPGMSFCLAGVLSVFVFTASATASTCTQWVAKAVSVQGSVLAQRTGEERPLPAKLNDTFCPGDKIRVEEGGRAVLLLSNETFLRLNQNTTIRFYEPEKERNFLLDLLEGAAYFISRTPKGFKCTTPYMNAGVEGNGIPAGGRGREDLPVDLRRNGAGRELLRRPPAGGGAIRRGGGREAAGRSDRGTSTGCGSLDAVLPPDPPAGTVGASPGGPGGMAIPGLPAACRGPRGRGRSGNRGGSEKGA